MENENEVEIYYDREGNYLEIIFEKKEGFFQETEEDNVMKKVDKEGNVLALSILNAVSSKEIQPLSYHIKNFRLNKKIFEVNNVNDKGEEYKK
jgi:hypothetical protein